MRDSPGCARAQASLYAGTPLLALLCVYWAFALTTHLNIGHRHLLPIYPALCILAGGAAFWIQPLFERRRKAEPRTGRERRKQRAHGAALTVTCRVVRECCWRWRPWRCWRGTRCESVAIRPNYLAYFNQLAGGPSQGYKHLADSSLDWGQDLPALKQWLDWRGTAAAGRESPCICRTSAPLVPSTTASVRLCWRDSSIVVRRRRPRRSVPASTASAPRCCDVISAHVLQARAGEQLPGGARRT